MPRRWPPRMRPVHGPEHRSIMVVDIAGSARWHNQAQLRARKVLQLALRAAVGAAGVAWAEMAVADRGDGVALLIPPSVSKVAILNPVVPRLAEEIRAHNATAEPELRMQLRVAVHAGEVHRDAYGWTGTDLITACRLVDGGPLYEEMSRAPQPDLVLVVSALIFDSVVRHGYPGVDPASYVQVQVRRKEFDAPAWLHVPGRTAALPGRS